jgi:hypothetical protein
MTYNFSVSDILYSVMEIPHNKAGKFLFSILLLSVNSSVKLLPTDSLTHHKLVTRVFLMEYYRL